MSKAENSSVSETTKISFSSNHPKSIRDMGWTIYEQSCASFFLRCLLGLIIMKNFNSTVQLHVQLWSAPIWKKKLKFGNNFGKKKFLYSQTRSFSGNIFYITRSTTIFLKMTAILSLFFYRCKKLRCKIVPTDLWMRDT